MALEEKIDAELKAAMKEKNATKVSTLRMLKSAVNNLRLTGDKKELTDADVIKILQQQIKQHRDSIDQFKKGAREDLVEKEQKELDILLSYLPEQCSPEEIKKIAEEIAKGLGASGKKDMGKVIKAVMEKLKGRAEGKTVSQIVSGLLEKGL